MKKQKPVDLWSQAAAAVLGTILFLIEKTPLSVVLLLVVIFILLIHPVWNFWWIEQSRVRRGASLLLLALGLIAMGWTAWPKPDYPEPTMAQQREFINILREIPHPEQKIRVGCDASPDICARTSNFIDLLQEANWTVRGNQMERGNLGRPVAGVSIAIHGTGDIPNPDDPKWGLWTKVTREQQVLTRALKAAGFNPTQIALRTVLETEILVIFGPEPTEN